MMVRGARSCLQALLWMVYPLAVLLGLNFMSARYVALCLVAALLLRYAQGARRFLTTLSGLERGLCAAQLALAATVALTDSEAVLRFYPVAVNVGMLALFGVSLMRPPSMVERFARLGEPDLSADAVRYTRRVTQVWCLFFVANGGAALATAVAASREFWSLYNGLISYLLMAALFGGEWLCRRRILAQARAK